MPVTYRYDSSRNRIHTACEGYVTLQEAMAHFRTLAADEAVGIHADLILDLRGTTSVPHIEQMAKVAEGIDPLAAELRFGRCAILAHRDRVYGMARMFMAMSGSAFGDVRIFADVPTAERWLDDSPRS